jgi:hypothetical protein
MMARLILTACIVCAAGWAWAQLQFPPQSMPRSMPKFIEPPHGGPGPGTQVGPAKTLAHVPLHPEEAAGRVPKMTHTGPNGQIAHMMPTVPVLARRRASGVGLAGGPLVYHTGGAIMQPYVAVYLIFWAPPTLQTGAPTGYSPNYGTPTILTGAWLPGHNPFQITTQYFQTISGTTTYINNSGGLGGYVVDNGAYPASGCTDSATPGNCITDAQMQAKIKSVMTAQGWTGGMNKIFILLTSSGEGSCFDSTSASCAYVNFCAYHSLISGSPNIIYAVQPYGDPTHCKVAGQTTPNDANGDLAANTMTHEIAEAATDPLLNAWFDTSGNEIGDLCNFVFGTNSWGSGAGAGNYMWNGFIFEVQQEWNNHFNGGTGGCTQGGPE